MSERSSLLWWLFGLTLFLTGVAMAIAAFMDCLAMGGTALFCFMSLG